MLAKVRDLLEGATLLREVRGLRREVKGLRDAVTRVATALELRNLREYPEAPQIDPTLPAAEVTFVDREEERQLMEIELQLTQQLGRTPTEAEIFETYDQLREASGP